jgi:pimeloyl-[acyl-carrier protein] methyl ester esterase
MALYTYTVGSGPDLVMLHGWSLHGGLFAPLATALSDRFRVTSIDLPGHGRSPFDPPFADLAGLARTVSPLLPPRCTLLGWSLGSLVAARLASAGDHRIERLVLVAATPRFVRNASWEHGLSSEVVHEFAAELGRDPEELVRRFLSLQARGDDRQVSLLRQLRASVFEHGRPDPAALAAGLSVLTESDLREDLPRITVPTLVVSGEYDRLTPPGAAAWMAARIPGARLSLLKAAGHAPFLSHPEAFLDSLRDFLAADGERRARA